MRMLKVDSFLITVIAMPIVGIRLIIEAEVDS